MGLPKCRLDVWKPTIGGTSYARWVTAQNPENQNAVISVFILDKLANSRVADVTLSNRAKNFASTEPFDYHYQDSEGNNLSSGDAFELSENRGVLTNLFHDFMQVRLVDEATNQVLYTGRIIDVDEAYDARQGQILRIKMRDALDELATISVKGLLETIEFYAAGASGTGISSSHSGHSITDMVKAYIACGYKKEYLPFATTKNVTGFQKSGLGSKTVTTDELIVDTTYDPANYIANLVTDDTGSVEYLSRFQEETKAVSSNRKVDFKKTANRGLLGEILRTLQTAPQDSQQNNQYFGWDYYIDPNISYQEHADFKGKNLLPTAPPPPAMFNTFRRGKRVKNIEPATYGLAVKYPAAPPAVESQGHYTDESTNPDTVRYATKPMSHEFDFTRPKDKLYSSLVLKYTDKDTEYFGAKKVGKEGIDKEVVLYILYVTDITGQFRYGSFSGSGDTAYVAPYTFWDDFEAPWPPAPGSTSAEYLDLYDDSNNLLVQNMARIQYQSGIISGSTNYGYILVSHLDKSLLTRTAGNYVLKGVGDGSGSNASTVTCDLNLNTSIASNGFPRRVWGVDRQHTVSRGSVTDLHSLRQEAAAMLSRSSTEIVDGAFAFSGPPMYHYDAEIRVVTSVSGGQRIQVRNPGGTTNVILSWYGFRTGMLIAKMNSTYSAIATTNVTVNGVTVAKDLYGYCWNREIGEVWSITLSEGQSFSVGDKIRFFVPIRAGDTIRVENVLSNVSGNHLVKEIEYTEEPNQMTRLKTTGVNEGIGLDGVRYAPLLAGSREESDLRMNLPAGHSPALWTGIFSAVDNNTVQWQTVASKADVILGDGRVYSIDVATADGNNTTHATSEDAAETAFGIANAAHPAAGDATVYYIYVDPNTESVVGGEKHHFYTRPATSPVSGSDAVYSQDGDNIIVGWMKAGATTDDLAEFGVYRDSKPGEGKRNASLVTHAGTATSALLKKGAQTFITDLMIEASTWANDLARREVKWHGGEKSDGSEDTVNATIKMADGDSRTIAYGGDSGDTGGGSYTYTSTGLANSYSSINDFSDNKTYYAFIDFKENPTGNMLLRWSDNVAVPYGDDRVLLSIIVVPPDATKGRAPIIFPLTTKSLSINAVVIAANSITGDHVQANTIATGHITGRIAGDKVIINASTDFAVGYDPIAKITTFVQNGVPTALTSGDIWFDNDDDNKCYLATNAGDNQIGSGEWIYKDVNAAKATADSKTLTFAQDGIPVSITIGDIWIDTNDDNKVYRAKIVGADQINSNEWVLYDLNNARAIADGKIQTFIQNGIPTAISVGDIWIDSNDDYKSYMAASVGADQINAQEWVHYDFGLARGRADTAFTNAGTAQTRADDAFDDAGDAQSTANRKRVIIRKTSTPNTGDNGGVAFVTGDMWINTNDQKFYSWTGSTWGLRDDAGAINNATTNIAGGRIVTQTIILKSGGAGMPDNANSVLNQDTVSNNGAGASRVVLSNTGIYGWNSAGTEGFSMRIDGSAQFGAGTGFIDRTGMYINNSSGNKVFYAHKDAGAMIGEGYNSKIDFRNFSTNLIGTWMVSESGGSSTYSSNSEAQFYIGTFNRDFLLESYNQDLGFEVDQVYGKVVVFAGTGSGMGGSSPRPLVFMDSASGSYFHNSTYNYVGLTKRTGAIKSGSNNRCTVYRLPWEDGTGGPTGSGDAGKVLAITGSRSGSGTLQAPYLYDLEWTAAAGSVPDPLRLGDGTYTAPSYSFTNDTNTGMYSGGNNVINFSCNSNPRVQFNTSGINMVGGDSSSYIYGVHIIRTNNGSASAPSYTFNPSNDDTGMYYSSGLSFSVDGSRKLGLDSATVSVYGYLNISTVTTGGVYDLKWGTDNFVYRSSSSTRKAKMNIEPLTIDTSKIYDLDLKSFNFRGVIFEDGVAIYDDVPGEKSFGLIAEEVYEILPELAVLDNGEPATVDYKMLSVLLLAELKELRTRIEVLEGN